LPFHENPDPKTPVIYCKTQGKFVSYQHISSCIYFCFKSNTHWLHGSTFRQNVCCGGFSRGVSRDYQNVPRQSDRAERRVRAPALQSPFRSLREAGSIRKVKHFSRNIPVFINKTKPCFISSSRSVVSVRVWASQIRIRNYLYGFVFFRQQAKIKKSLDLYSFMTSGP
jgi:hypothetical protein